MSDKITAVFGEPVDEGALAQLRTCLKDDRAVVGALMADHHRGYSMPIGGVIAYQDAISPSGVGFDIACGNMAVRTEMRAAEVEVPSVMREIQQQVEFGVGRSNTKPIDHELFDSDVWKEFGEHGEPLKQKARAQLGTVGSGNHYVDLLEDEHGDLWIANHFGSRGFGHTVATWFMAIAYGAGRLGERVTEREEPAVLDVRSPAGDLYIRAMELAGRYAYAGREYVIGQVLRILGNPKVRASVHNHHNFAWFENNLWVVRKGATPLTREAAFIGGSMGDMSVIVRGAPIPEGHAIGDKKAVVDIGAIASAPHGAGRQMSRTKAAGKFRKVTEIRTRPDGTEYEFKRRVRDPSTGAVDWPAVKQGLADRGITVLGSGADEAPAVYKDLMVVLEQHSNIEVLTTLRPLGVVMAGDETYDPYKD